MKKNPSKQSRFFLYFRLYKRSELLVHVIVRELASTLRTIHSPLRMNFSNYQNRRKLIQFPGIDLYAILKPSKNFKMNWITNFEIIPLLIFGYLTCILMGKYNMKKMLLKIQSIIIYQSLWKFGIKGWNIKRNYYKNSAELIRYFFLQLNINGTKTVSPE